MEAKRRTNARILVVGSMLLLIFSALTGRLWWIQKVDAAWIMEKGASQWEREKILQPKRGSILDRNLEVLAYEGKAYTVNARLHPRNEKEAKLAGDDYVKDPFMTAQKLSPILGIPVEKLVRTLSQPDKFNVWLGREAWKITEDQKDKILALQYPKDINGKKAEENQLPGIELIETSRRYYPNNSFASHVLGYLTYEDKAEMGIELQFDEQLKGEAGELQLMKDGAGYPLPDGERKYKPAKDGLNIVLTLDQQIQDYVEQALDKTVSEYNPNKITVVVTDPQTGEVLAMASRPHFNPNKYWEITNYLNLAISFPFEPGSTFKIMTLAAAIEEGVYRSDEEYQSGSYRKVPGKPINDHNYGHGWGKITFLEGVQRSSNVAFVILGMDRLKQELLTKYYDAFGIGKKTGIDLPGEVRGNVDNVTNPRSPRDIAVTTFGQGVAVNAIQQAMAVGAIANGGELLKPLIVKEWRDPHSNAVVKKYDRQVVRRVISENTAKQTRDILETVVTGEKGTGRAFEIKGYHVAGKTGTAQKYDEHTGKIIEGRYIVSFIGFAPKDNPRLLVSVVVDDPQTNLSSNELGKKVVAPIFNSVMEQSLRYLQQQPDMKDVETQKAAVQSAEVVAPTKEVSMPDLVGMSSATAGIKAKQTGLVPKTVGTGTKITRQFPGEGERVIPGAEVILVTDRLQDVKLPDFTGKSLREVMEFASIVNLTVIPNGSGYVQSQSLPAGTTLTGKEKLSITLSTDTPKEK